MYGNKLRMVCLKVYLTPDVMQHQYIFIIGGYSQWTTPIDSDKVHIINSATNEVSLSNDRLVYRLHGSASIIANNKILVFGGTANRQVSTAGNISLYLTS